MYRDWRLYIQSFISKTQIIKLALTSLLIMIVINKSDAILLRITYNNSTNTLMANVLLIVIVMF